MILTEEVLHFRAKIEIDMEEPRALARPCFDLFDVLKRNLVVDQIQIQMGQTWIATSCLHLVTNKILHVSSAIIFDLTHARG